MQVSSNWAPAILLESTTNLLARTGAVAAERIFTFISTEKYSINRALMKDRVTNGLKNPANAGWGTASEYLELKSF